MLKAQIIIEINSKSLKQAQHIIDTIFEQYIEEDKIYSYHSKVKYGKKWIRCCDAIK
jgi:hypothetical protein